MSQTNARKDGEVGIASNLHFVLETQRIGTISEATGRSSSFLQSVSMAFVATGFIAPATRFGPEFFAFALAVLGVLLVLGLVTFFRMVQLGIEDVRLAVRMQSIEELYVEHAPALERAKIVGPTMKRHNYNDIKQFRTQMFLTNASLIAVVDAALAAALAAVAGHFWSGDLAFEITLSVVAFVVAFIVLMRSQFQMWLPTIRNEDT